MSLQLFEPSPASSPVHERRREVVFIILAGMFLGTLTMLNILGVTRFVDLSFSLPLTDLRIPMVIAVGALPYPVTFLCTDFLSEFYGQRRANTVVLVGLLLNVWVVVILWVGGAVPGTEPPGSEGTGVFFEVRHLAFGAVSASMIAYLAAQLIDVKLFHFWKGVTRGRHLWLRNNGSTMVSQLVDTCAVILITHYYAHALPIVATRPTTDQLVEFIAAGYVFKLLVAAVDTLPFYAGVKILSGYLAVDSMAEEA